MVETPPKYADFLRNFGGTNLYDEPNFILVWCDSPIKRLGVPDFAFGPYLNSWVLAEWSPPEEWGLESDWDEKLMRMEFPKRGLYFPLQIFRTPDGKGPAQLDSAALNLDVLACWVYNCINHKRDSLQKRKSVIGEEWAKRDASELNRLADRLQDAYPAFGVANALAYNGQSGTKSVLRERMEKIEKQMPWVRNFHKRFPRKHSIVAI